MENHEIVEEEVAIGIPLWDREPPYQPISSEDEKEDEIDKISSAELLLLFFIMVGSLGTIFFHKDAAPRIKVEYMDFTAQNVTESQINAKWDVALMMPRDFARYTESSKGEIQVRVLFKNETIATSSMKRYEIKYVEPKLLSVAVEENIKNETGKGIIESIEESGAVSFGTEFLLMGQREIRTWEMRYTCGEVKVEFLQSSNTMGTRFGQGSKCVMTWFGYSD